MSHKIGTLACILIRQIRALRGCHQARHSGRLHLVNHSKQTASIILPRSLSFFFLSLLVYFHALEMSGLMLSCILMHFLYTSVSFLAHCIAGHPGRKWAFRFRKCFWEKGFRVAAVSKPAILGWYLFCLTVRRYQTHNIQYFTVCDSFFLYHLAVLFWPNKQWEGFWKLSICSFLVMTFHQKLMNIWFFPPPAGVASFLLYPHQFKAPLTASPSCISFLSTSEGEGSPRRVFPSGQE